MDGRSYHLRSRRQHANTFYDPIENKIILSNDVNYPYAHHGRHQLSAYSDGTYQASDYPTEYHSTDPYASWFYQAHLSRPAHGHHELTGGLEYDYKLNSGHDSSAYESEYSAPLSYELESYAPQSYQTQPSRSRYLHRQQKSYLANQKYPDSSYPYPRPQRLEPLPPTTFSLDTLLPIKATRREVPRDSHNGRMLEPKKKPEPKSNPKPVKGKKKDKKHVSKGEKSVKPKHDRNASNSAVGRQPKRTLSGETLAVRQPKRTLSGETLIEKESWFEAYMRLKGIDTEGGNAGTLGVDGLRGSNGN